MAQTIDPKQLVVIDDDPDMQDLLVAFFRPKGYQVTVFDDAESALESSKNMALKWDVLITDLQLPKMSGIEFIGNIKKIRPDLPIVLITVSKSAEMAVKAIRQGAYDFIVKPIHFPQLQISIERAIHLGSLTESISDLREHIRDKEVRVNNNIIGRSPKFIRALEIAKRVAKSSANIFVAGESGTGKEVIARFIHAESTRKKGPFIAINCSAIPENLLESELFGHAKGSFTGAVDKKLGLFEEAENGTLFLDEIGDLSMPLQAKLLRVLQERKIKRVGENQTRAINARIISATHKNLPQEIADGKFREDLFFRLNVIPIHLPTLRDRPEDILPLAESFLKKFAIMNGSPARSFSKEATRSLLENHWRGNVRELENCIERAVVMAAEAQIKESDFMTYSPNSPEDDATGSTANIDDFSIKFEGKLEALQDVIQKYIEYAVTKNDGAKDKTAKDLGIDRKTLYKRMRLPDEKAI